MCRDSEVNCGLVYIFLLLLTTLYVNVLGLDCSVMNTLVCV
jgi:hypothetical protein